MLPDLVVGSRRIGWSSGAGICSCTCLRETPHLSEASIAVMYSMLKRTFLADYEFIIVRIDVKGIRHVPSKSLSELSER
jgi:hypothetical protein